MLHCWPFVRGIHRSPVNSPPKGLLMWKVFPCHDIFMMCTHFSEATATLELVSQELVFFSQKLVPSCRGEPLTTQLYPTGDSDSSGLLNVPSPQGLLRRRSSPSKLAARDRSSPDTKRQCRIELDDSFSIEDTENDIAQPSPRARRNKGTTIKVNVMEYKPSVTEELRLDSLETTTPPASPEWPASNSNKKHVLCSESLTENPEHSGDRSGSIGDCEVFVSDTSGASDSDQPDGRKYKKSPQNKSDRVKRHAAERRGSLKSLKSSKKNLGNIPEEESGSCPEGREILYILPESSPECCRARNTMYPHITMGAAKPGT